MIRFVVDMHQTKEAFSFLVVTGRLAEKNGAGCTESAMQVKGRRKVYFPMPRLERFPGRQPPSGAHRNDTITDKRRSPTPGAAGRLPAYGALTITLALLAVSTTACAAVRRL